MNNNLWDIDILPTSDKLFDEITLMFGEIKRLLSSWDFQVEPWKTDFLSKKKSFFLLLRKVLCNKNIETFFANTYDIKHLKWLENSDFSLIFDLYKLLELYFASQYIPLEKEVIIPKIELLQTLETKEEYSWSHISSLFWNDRMFTRKDCYEILQKFDLGQYTDEDLQTNMKHMKDFLISKKSKDIELINFVGFFVKNIRNYLEVKHEKFKLIKEKEEIEKKNSIVKETFLSGLHFFDEFVVWAKKHIEETSDFKNIASLEDLQKDTEMYSSFLQFRIIFSSTYRENVAIPYKNLFEKNDTIDIKNYSTVLRDLNCLWEAYNKDISESAFFMWLKKWFLLGDIYEFLYKQNQKFPDLASHLHWLLWEEFTTYTTKLQP